MNIFDTDFYQLTMAMSYINDGTADDIVGFEAFYRNPKKGLNKNYSFSGESDIINLMSQVSVEIKSENFGQYFYDLIEHRIPEDRKSSYRLKIKTFFDSCNKDFEYSVYPEGAKLLPYMPYFQFKGPKWIGQLLETNVLATANGKTAFHTLLESQDISKRDKVFFETLVMSVDPLNEPALNEYFNGLEDRAIEYNKAKQNIILLDASFRRAPSKAIAMIASKIAIDNGWDGSANVGALQRGLVDRDKIGGTHAHSLIMANAPYGKDSELDAFLKWNNTFPNTTMLVDTYDTMRAISKIINNNLFPSDIRIDSEPLEDFATEARSTLNKNNRRDCGIFLSGDMTPERLIYFNDQGVPIDKTMAGTMYVNYGKSIAVNSGFVYKIVEVHANGKTYYPEKAAAGKKSIGGLKRVIVGKSFKKNDDWGIFST